MSKDYALILICLVKILHLRHSSESCVNLRPLTPESSSPATLVTEHILFCLCIVIFLFSFIDVISVNTVNVITFVNSAKQ